MQTHWAHAKAGKAADLGDIHFRSAYERNYARFLNFQKIKWKYEYRVFWFDRIKRGVRSYLPDFYLPDKDEYVEVKGFWDKRSLTKMKRMRIYYPEIKISSVDSAFFKQIEKNRTCKIIPHWECSHNNK